MGDLARRAKRAGFNFLFLGEGPCERARRLIKAVLTLAVLAAAGPGAFGEVFPKPIRLVIPSPTGGYPDIIGRLLSSGLAERLAQFLREAPNPYCSSCSHPRLWA